MKYSQATVEELLEADAALTAEDWDRAHALYEAPTPAALTMRTFTRVWASRYKRAILMLPRHFGRVHSAPRAKMDNVFNRRVINGRVDLRVAFLDFAENQFPEIHQQLLAWGVINRATQSMDQMMPSDGSLGWNVADDAELIH